MKNIFKDKYVFVDFDGTLCEYRYDGHVSGKVADPESEHDWGQSMRELLFGDTFLKARPLKTMQKALSKCDPDKLYILGAIITKNEIDQKLIWLKKHYPQINEKNMFFLADLNLKVETLKLFCKEKNVKPEDVVFIDDTHSYLRRAEEEGFNAYHITSFVD